MTNDHIDRHLHIPIFLRLELTLPFMLFDWLPGFFVAVAFLICNWFAEERCRESFATQQLVGILLRWSCANAGILFLGLMATTKWIHISSGETTLQSFKFPLVLKICALMWVFIIVLRLCAILSEIILCRIARRRRD